MVTEVFWFSIAAAVVFTLRAVASHGWPTLWFAALVCYVASILSMFSIGVLVFLLPCLQLAAVAAIRLRLDLAGWAVALLTGLLVWIAIVPVQYFGPDIFGGIGAYQVVGLLGLLLVPLLPVFRMWIGHRHLKASRLASF